MAAMRRKDEHVDVVLLRFVNELDCHVGDVAVNHEKLQGGEHVDFFERKFAFLFFKKKEARDVDAHMIFDISLCLSAPSSIFLHQFVLGLFSALKDINSLCSSAVRNCSSETRECCSFCSFSCVSFPPTSKNEMAK